MAILPRYQQIGLKTRQPQQMDFAAAREQAKLGQNISQQLDRMSDFAFKKGAEQAELRGQERVREEGALPTLEALQQAGGPTTIAERAASDAANRIAVVEVESLAKQDMQNLVREADKTNMSMTAFEGSMADIRDGYAASLDAVDPVAAGVLAARLSNSSMTYQGRYADIASRKAVAAAAARVSEMVSVESQFILDSATVPGATRENLELAGKNLLEAQLTKGVNEKTARKVVNSVLRQALRQNRLYLFDNAADVEQKKILLDEYEKNPLPGYTYEQNRSFTGSLKSNLNAEVRKAQGSALDDLNNAMVVLGATGSPPPGYEFDSEKIFGIFPEDQAVLYKDAWIDANEDVLNRGALAKMTPDRALEIRKGLAAEIVTSKDPSKAIKRLADWEESVANRNDALDKDAALFIAQTNESVGGAFEAIQETIAAGNIDLASKMLLTVREILLVDYDILQVPTSKQNIMPKQFAGQMVNVIQSIETDVASETFNLIRNSLGDYAPQFIQELRDQGLRPEYVQAMYSTNAAVQKELLDISGLKIKDIIVGLDSNVPRDVKTELNAIVQDYRQAFLAGGDDRAIEIFIEQYAVMEKLALARINEHDLASSAAAEGVFQDIVAEFDQVVLSKQGKYVVPMEYNVQTIENNASMFLNENVLNRLDIAPLDSAKYPRFVNESVTIASLASTGMWLNNSTGDGLTLHFNVNGVELPVLKSDGSAYEVKFSEMSRILSETQEAIRSELPVVEPDIIKRAVSYAEPLVTEQVELGNVSQNDMTEVTTEVLENVAPIEISPSALSAEATAIIKNLKGN
tara:strand:- start:5443 stop:7857 length:2415 start_codon:yes stop_codon:yes gene_type:complete